MADENTNRAKEQLDEIMGKLEKGLTDLFSSDKYKQYLTTMAKFHNYSFNNTLLIAMQRPDATLVAGYNAWSKKFERHVVKGAKGIRIISPVTLKKTVEVRTSKNGGKTSRGKIPIYAPGETKEDYEKRTCEVKTKEVEYTAFRVTTVFDISDTEGKELPTVGVNELDRKVANYNKYISALTKMSRVPIEYADIQSGAKGYYSVSDKKIVIQKDMPEAQTLKTLIHEMAHSLLHDKDVNKEAGIDDQKSKSVKEVEAESIAYTVCSRFGIDTSDYSFGYIAGWSSGKDLKELRDSMEIIKKTSSLMIRECECAFAKEAEAEKNELAMMVDNHYFEIHRCDDGYDYSFYDENFHLLDGGVLENPCLTIQAAADEIMKDAGLNGAIAGKIKEISVEDLHENVAATEAKEMKIIDEKKISVIDKLKGKLNIVDTLAKADPKVIKTPELAK